MPRVSLPRDASRPRPHHPLDDHIQLAGRGQPTKPPVVKSTAISIVRLSIASASQVLVSAPERGHGRDAVSLFHQRSRPTPPAPGVARHRQGERDHCLCLLDVPGLPASWQGAAAPCQSIGCRLAAHRADTPLPTARSCGPASRFALFPGHSTAFASSMALGYASQCTRRCCAPFKGLQRCMASASQCGSQSAVALGVGHGSLRIVAERWIHGGDGVHSSGHTLCFYIRPHCVKWSPVSRAAPLVSSTASRPAGLRSRPYVKWPTLVRAYQSSALPRSVPALRAANCRPRVVLALWLWSVAPQVLLVSGLRPCILRLPRPPLASPRYAWLWPGAVCPSAPRGLPQNRVGSRRLGGEP